MEPEKAVSSNDSGPVAPVDVRIDADLTVVTDDTEWRFEGDFLRSGWSCRWGNGCKGIGDEPATSDYDGCCTIGAELFDVDEAMNVAALATTVDPSRFQHHHVLDEGIDGIFLDAQRNHTAVVDGACVFLNRPGFAGGPGCALHLEAVAQGESPIDWKPSVCWQLPIRVDWEPLPDGRERATVRRWQRRDWGTDGETMAWCCTEGDLAYVSDRPVIETLAEELRGVVGTEVYLAVRRRLADDR